MVSLKDLQSKLLKPQHTSLVLTASNQKLFTGIQFSRLRITLENLISTDTYSKVPNQREVQATMLMGKNSEIE